VTRQTQPITFATMLGVSAIALVACGRTPTGPVPSARAAQGSEVPEVATLEADQPTGTARAVTAGETAPDDELRRREAELAQRERELRLQQEELRRERERLEAARSGGRPSDDSEYSYDADEATSTTAANASIQKVPTPPIVVPSGTPLEIELAANVNTKVARVGDRVEGRLASDLVVDERRAAVAGAPVTGSVTELVSGSDKVGGAPTLVVTFNSLQAANGATIPILAKFRKQGDSDTASDAAKVVGGAAAGAVIGHQVDDDDKDSDRGTVVGGILGGAAGAVAAQKTGSEVKIRAGTVITAPTETTFSIY
jgi:membrane-bound lytic murein transglycosylase